MAGALSGKKLSTTPCRVATYKNSPGKLSGPFETRLSLKCNDKKSRLGLDNTPIGLRRPYAGRGGFGTEAGARLAPSARLHRPGALANDPNTDTGRPLWLYCCPSGASNILAET